MNILRNPNSSQLAQALTRPLADDPVTRQRVKAILDDVKANGDDAILRLNREIDRYDSPYLEISRQEMVAAAALVSGELKDSLHLAIRNIEKFHSAERPADITMETMPGVTCTFRTLPYERVGLYIPGGTAPLLSTIAMLAVPARVAGCREVVICTPPNPIPELLYALSLFDARVFQVGGAQAIAAMAFGTSTIPRVDKIFGPGNRYVTEAKMQVSALGVPIDMPAGPSEVLVIADHTARPSFVAADLLSQAEHGADSQVILVTTSEQLIADALTEVKRQVEKLPRRDTALKCLESSTAILVQTLAQAMEVSNQYAPEHLILAVDNPHKLARGIRHAGSVFMGHYTPESVGDYTSGTNHTLPTAGFARSWSGVSLLSFLRTITFQELTPQGLQSLQAATTCLARAEGLEAHARAVEVRGEEP